MYVYIHNEERVWRRRTVGQEWWRGAVGREGRVEGRGEGRGVEAAAEIGR